MENLKQQIWDAFPDTLRVMSEAMTIRDPHVPKPLECLEQIFEFYQKKQNLRPHNGSYQIVECVPSFTKKYLQRSGNTFLQTFIKNYKASQKFQETTDISWKEFIGLDFSKVIFSWFDYTDNPSSPFNRYSWNWNFVTETGLKVQFALIYYPGIGIKYRFNVTDYQCSVKSKDALWFFETIERITNFEIRAPSRFRAIGPVSCMIHDDSFIHNIIEEYLCKLQNEQKHQGKKKVLQRPPPANPGFVEPSAPQQTTRQKLLQRRAKLEAFLDNVQNYQFTNPQRIRQLEKQLQQLRKLV
jgi:hypothetical protein